MSTTLDQTSIENFKKCVSFLESIGIIIILKTIEGSSVLPGLSIENGCLIIDKDKLLYPGDILHEAGHIAVVPAAERDTLNDATIGSRKDHAAEEMMAIAWSYAACVHLQLDADFVFHESGYKGESNQIAESFKQGQYFAVPMLQWVGMALDRKNATDPTKPVYPEMLQWLRS